MKAKTINVYNDPGHGWAKVSFTFLKKLGIERQITPYSYMRNGFVFLEEDCDLSLFCLACKNQGIELKFRDHHTDRRSKIRSYQSYNESWGI